MKYSFFLLLFIFCLAGNTVAQQFSISGQVRDAVTHEALPFVSILLNDGQSGTTSDIDGKFRTSSKVPVKTLKFSYLGYLPQEVNPATGTTYLTIILQPAETSLQEVVIRAGNNPAHRIIKLATLNRKKNDPAELPEYACRIYNKTVVTFEPGSVNMADTLHLATHNRKRTPEEKQKAEADQKEMEDFLAKSNLFLSESVSDLAFKKPDLSKETVLATRVSGLKNPSFAILAANSQLFSVYKDLVTFFDKTYLSPLSEGSTRKYDFQMEDTTYMGTDTIFIISYRPLPGKNFEGLKGQLHICSNGWAVENIIAEADTKEQQRIRIQQHYQKIDNSKWFPVQVNTDFVLDALLVNGRKATAFTRSYYTNINLSPGLKRREFQAVTIKMNDDAARQPEAFWQQHRPDSLSTKERNTYLKVDSLGKVANLDARFRMMEAMFSKRLPFGPVSVDLDRLINVNRYENLRLGIGLHTNEQLSGFFSVGGYAAYGFRNKALKYGGDLGFSLYKPAGLKLTFTHTEDVQESGGIRLPFYNPPLLSNNLRPYLIGNMDKVTHRSAFISLRTLKYLDLKLGLQEEYKRTTNGYTYEIAPDNISNNFYFTEAVVGLRYAFREQVMEMFKNNISLGTGYPVFWLQYSQGLNQILNGGFTYHKFDFRAEKTFKHKALGTTGIILTGGLVLGDVPYPNLYNGNGSWANEKMAVYTGEGFQTMGMNEFLSDRFAAVYLNHNFAGLLFKSEHFSPGVAVVTNIGYGRLQHAERHQNIAFSTMEKGYYESGLLLNNLFKVNFLSLGAGAFYRYGAYRLPAFKDNLAIKATASFTF